MAEQKWNEGHDHEALHVCHILQEMLYQYVEITPTCDKYPDVKAACEKASEALMNLYQLIGTKWDG